MSNTFEEVKAAEDRQVYLRNLPVALIEELEKLTKGERKDVLDQVHDAFCFHCGRDHRGGFMRCKCWNDE